MNAVEELQAEAPSKDPRIPDQYNATRRRHAGNPFRHCPVASLPTPASCVTPASCPTAPGADPFPYKSTLPDGLSLRDTG
jgi:hypothetical protein